MIDFTTKPCNRKRDSILCYNKEIWLCWLWRGFVANIKRKKKRRIRKIGIKEEVEENQGIINKSK